MSANTNFRRLEQALKCFDQIKKSISEAGGRIEVSRLSEKLKKKRMQQRRQKKHNKHNR